MYTTSDIRKGLKIEIDGVPYQVAEFQFIKPGKGSTFTRTLLTPLLEGPVLTVNFKTDEKLMPADWTETAVVYADNDGADWRFVDAYIPEQELRVPLALAEPALPYLFPGGAATVSQYNGAVVKLVLPETIDVVVASVSRPEDREVTTQPATLANGTVIEVPRTVYEGQTIRVSTKTGAYVQTV